MESEASQPPEAPHPSETLQETEALQQSEALQQRPGVPGLIAIMTHPGGQENDGERFVSFLRIPLDILAQSLSLMITSWSLPGVELKFWHCVGIVAFRTLALFCCGFYSYQWREFSKEMIRSLVVGQLWATCWILSTCYILQETFSVPGSPSVIHDTFVATALLLGMRFLRYRIHLHYNDPKSYPLLVERDDSEVIETEEEVAFDGSKEDSGEIEGESAGSPSQGFEEGSEAEQMPDRRWLQRIALKSPHRNQRFAYASLSEVDKIECEGEQLYVFLRGRKALAERKGSLTELSGLLDPNQFKRCHRGTIVNLTRVLGYRKAARKGWKLSLPGGLECAVGPTYTDILKDLDYASLDPSVVRNAPRRP